MRKVEITIEDFPCDWFTNCWVMNIKYLEHEAKNFLVPPQLVKDAPAFGAYLSNRIQRIISESAN